MTAPHEHATGWIPDPPRDNHRDRVMAAGELYGDSLPAEVSLSHLLPVRPASQGSDARCVAEALALGVWAAMARAGVPSDQLELCSRKVIWFFGRRMLGTEDLNAGMHVRDGAEWIGAHGVQRERHFPASRHYGEAPTLDVLRLGYDQRRANGGIHTTRLIEPHGAARVEAFRRSIAAGIPVVAGTVFHERFRRIGGDYPYEPNGSDVEDGRHAMVLVGYKPGLFRVRNSWGEWADGGECWITADWAGTWQDPWTVLRAPAYSDRI